MWPWIARILLALAAIAGAAAVGLVMQMIGESATNLAPIVLQALVVVGSFASAVLVVCALLLVLDAPPRGAARHGG